MCNAIRGHSDNRRAWEVALLRTAACYYPIKRKGVEKQIQNVTNNLIIISQIFFETA